MTLLTPDPAPALRGRRVVFAGLVAVTCTAVFIMMLRLLGADGLTFAETAVVICFAGMLPWTVVGFWNAVIGFGLLAFARDPAGLVAPVGRRGDPKRPIKSRVAIIMPAYNESPDRVFRNLHAVARTLDATGDAAQFDIHFLSDSNDPEIIAEEEARFAAWRAIDPRPERLFYRRRTDNRGQKTGNIWEFLDRCGDHYDYFVVLDADSLMSGDLIARLTRIMEVSPELGILQTLAVGLPAVAPFTRLFQFGMRHGMRAFTTGSAWWQGDEGPYWGHNAILRMAPFRRHCRLPMLPGRAPWGGQILSHDQVEAVLMRRAGYQVRVIPEEGGSYEENPPSLVDFIRRELRWTQGNFQYVSLLATPGLRWVGRIQLVLAILMYLSPVLWLVSTWICFFFVNFGTVDPKLGGWLFLTMMSMVFAPKLFGLADVMIRESRRRTYGGGLKVAAGALAELVMSVVIAPIIAGAITVFAFGMLCGRAIRWRTQARDVVGLPWIVAVRALWPQTLIGGATALWFAVTAPWVLPYAAPILFGLVFGVPISWVTALPVIGRGFQRIGLGDIPEDLTPTPEVVIAGFVVPERATAAAPGLVALPQPE